MNNTIEVVFREDGRQVYTKTMYQYDHGISMHFSGIVLPEKFKVHFSNDGRDGISTKVDGKNYVVRIPDVYLATGQFVYCWVYVDQATCYKVIIPVEKRARVYEMNDADDPKKTTYAFTMDKDETLGITTVEEDEDKSMSGFQMSEDGETLEYVP